MTLRHAALFAVLTAPLLAALPGCGALDQPLSQDDRSVLTDCRSEADRVFSAQNRDKLSERDSSDTPNSADALPGNVNAGLGDRYRYDSLVDSCLARHGISPRTGTSN